jgi:hypothetical protein
MFKRANKTKKECLKYEGKKDKAMPVTGREGP